MSEKITTKTIRALKGKRPVVALTAYDAVIATLADKAGVDLLLVGDSVGTAMLGLESTVPVTDDMIAHHTAAVARAHPRALIVTDLAFPGGHRDWPDLLDACRRFLQEVGAEAVKIEGGVNISDKVSRLVEAGIPVLGHIGLLPQRFHAMGGYRRFGRTAPGRERLLNDARALEDAGVFAIIGEMIDAETTAILRDAVEIPLIGIGCGPDCDGQILVNSDLLGLTQGYIPSFAKRYAEVGDTVTRAFAQYASEVRDGTFPGPSKSS